MAASHKAWQDYVTRWRNCERCPLHATALEHVIYRGDRPCQVLFIGEAPGPTEDLLGTPFIGRAGKLLDKCIAEVRNDLYQKEPHPKSKDSCDVLDFTTGFANILCCFPVRDPSRLIGKDNVIKEGNFRAPTKEEAETCRPHLTELVTLLKPLVVVALGKATAKNIPKHWKKGNDAFRYLEVSHPSYWLRTGGHKGLEFKKARLALGDFLWEVFT